MLAVQQLSVIVLRIKLCKYNWREKNICRDSLKLNHKQHITRETITAASGTECSAALGNFNDLYF